MGILFRGGPVGTTGTEYPKKSPQILKMGAVLPRVGSVYRKLQLVAFADVGKVGTSGEGDNDASNDIFVKRLNSRKGSIGTLFKEAFWWVPWVVREVYK